ncbi:MAG: isoprenylcysteine carboxylmethyltransferase family protein [Algoriphagus sp.]|jgi:methanethiol S-methyltransferase|uniref:methyltransferase family protein n=1 Tax=Algoriphagus sp. TaxID=1872435 RepID=UPI002627519C|nr:isoprenylcysteine carboxylmethyltransferase family protein [Algoriphagus sp.]MDG1276240.1 isoprenylcysteine carboxylmethyltransferase family protein [Algoriphagus sp.]
MEYILLTLSWTVFYTLHSLLASSKLKRILRVKIGSAFKWYRLFYSVFSLVLITGIMVQSALIPKIILISKGTFTIYLGYLFAAFGTIILVKSAKKIALSNFIGFNSSEQKQEKLVISGIYSKIRHPLYAGLILVFLGYFFFSGSVTAAVHLACLLVYLPFGIYFEEKNLIDLFGDQYKVYRTKVPAILPWL